jgi:hypothetical protein
MKFDKDRFAQITMLLGIAIAVWFLAKMFVA